MGCECIITAAGIPVGKESCIESAILVRQVQGIMVFRTEAVDGRIDITLIISVFRSEGPVVFRFPLILHMGIGSGQCHVVIELMV